VFRILVTLMMLWTLGTVLWFLAPRNTSNQLVTRAKSSLEGFEHGVGQLTPPERAKAVTNQSRATPAAAPAEASAAAVQPTGQSTLPQSAPGPSIPGPAVPSQSVPELRSVFRTSAQQLYQDFNANVVAIQTRIGSSRVRVTGTVGEIDQDVAGHPVVKLRTGKENAAAMSLTEDQRAAAAQLVKDEAVEIECDKIGHNGELLEGSGCTLALVDAQPKQVNLALFVANDNGTTGVYVVGPMSESDCFAQGDSMPPKMHISSQGEYVVWRGCTNAARETIAPEGCRLNASPVAIPGMGSAHLFRYDCGTSGAVRTSVRKRSSTSSHSSVGVPDNESTADAKTVAQPPPGRDEAQDPTTAKAFALTMPVAKAAEPTPSPVAPAAAAATAATLATVATAGAVAPAASAAPAEVARTQTSDLHLASASDSDINSMTAGAHAPVGEVTVSHPTQNHPEPTGTAHSDPQGSATPEPRATADDLAQVRAVDPQAADHIASYCDKTMVSANRDALVTECRHSEADAWTRLVLKNEFPTLDDATRRKCSEPPFPDTYVAKESCARYELHLN
jgi:hypothetical protein